MNIQECREKKEELECAIAHLLYMFKKETELDVDGIHLHTLRLDTAGSPSKNMVSHVEVEVTL